MSETPRDRMVRAAFALFDEQGYAATTVEAIVERAGVSRSTFFRAFGTKEDVIFPSHEAVQERIAARLATAGPATVATAVSEAAGLVLEQYLAEGALARARYRLTRSVPALREREVASMLGYQRLFRDEVRRHTSGEGRVDVGADEVVVGLHAELLAGAVVTAHNVVLRRWLREETDEPTARVELDRALAVVLSGIRARDPGGLGAPEDPEGSAVVVLRSGARLEEVVPQLRRALGLDG